MKWNIFFFFEIERERTGISNNGINDMVRAFVGCKHSPQKKKTFYNKLLFY